MKDFIKIVFGNLVAMGLFLFFGFVFLAVVVVGLLMDEPEVAVEANSVVVFDMSVAITDAPPGADLWRLMQEASGGVTESALSLRTVVEGIERAAADDRIAALYLQGSFVPSNVASGFSTMREVRGALLNFQESGKPIYAYLQNPTVRDYFVASVADEIVVNPYGAIGLNGLASQQLFLGELLEKYGVGVQVTRAGEFKSAVEMFTETEMSEENREQTVEMLDDLWGSILDGIAEARGLTVDQLQGLTDERGFIDPDRALEHGLADRSGYLDEVLADLRQVAGVGETDSIPQVGLAAYHERVTSGLRPQSEDFIAIVYLEGDLIDGQGMAGAVGGDAYAREIRRLREHPQVKALVLRVNSPGGSVTAADAIQREISLAREAMPVVVSFGSFAASGGYWVAVDSDRIFAQPSTITGSIGVFGILPNFEGIANRHGVHFDVVKTGEFADLFTLTRPKDERELALIQEYVDTVYEDFVELVAEGRGLSVEEARNLAGGRIWSGVRAVQNGLVDELGGLFDAIHYAADEAGLSHWELHEYPRPPRNLGEIFAEWFEEEEWEPLAKEIHTREFIRKTGFNPRLLDAFNDPRGAYARLPFFLRIE